MDEDTPSDALAPFVETQMEEDSPEDVQARALEGQLSRMRDLEQQLALAAQEVDEMEEDNKAEKLQSKLKETENALALALRQTQDMDEDNPEVEDLKKRLDEAERRLALVTAVTDGIQADALPALERKSLPAELTAGPETEPSASFLASPPACTEVRGPIQPEPPPVSSIDHILFRTWMIEPLLT